MQQTFSQHKGSIPARIDASDHLTGCLKKSFNDLETSIANNTLVPGVIHGIAVGDEIKASLINSVSRFMNNPHTDPEDAAKSLSLTILARSIP